MASPFKFFRTYSSGIMIVMVILSMLLFTMDGLFSDPGQNLWLLGLLLGGAVFGVAGIGQGKWLQWGIGGAVMGALLGFVLPGFVDTGGLKTSLGVISNDEINELETRRSVANRFMMESFEAAFGEGTARFARANLFGFGTYSNRDDVVFGKVMRAEADRLGIQVDAAMVKEYLARLNADKLTKSAYLDIRNGINYQGRPLTEDSLNEIIGDEIKAKMAWQMTRPRTTTLPPGPEVYWQYFRRFNVRQQLNLAALDVDDFVDQIEDPSDADINQLFTQYKTKFPNEDGPGEPGFRLRERVRVGYVELSSDAARSGIAAVTDEDIAAYYEENKESPLIRQPVMPDLEKDKEPAEPADKAADSESKEDAATKTPEAAADGSAAPEPAAKQDGEAAPATEAATPAAEEAKPAVETPATEPPATEPPAESKTESEDGTGSCEPFVDEEPAAADETAAADEPAADELKASDKAAESTPPAATEAKPTDEATTTTDEAAAPPEIPDSPKLEDVAATGPPEIQYEYRTLDDELKRQIKEMIEAERLNTFVKQKMEAASAKMDLLARERSAERFSLIEQDPDKYDVDEEELQAAFQQLREQMQPREAELISELKSYAKDNGLAYAETPLVSFNEFLEEEDYPLATASEPNDNPTLAAQSLSVAQTIFQGFNFDEQNNDAQLYMPRVAQKTTMSLEGGQSNYAYWAIDFSPSHIPELTEDGVRESVVLAWKRMKARELVTERGKQLVAKVKSGLAKEGDDKTDMATALKDETINGKSDGAALAVRITEPFSWLRSSMSQTTFQQQVFMSTIEFADANGGVLRKAGDEFMAKIFDDMKNEDVDVVPNMDLSKYYVVHVTNRFPTPEVGEDSLRERFASEGQQFGFQNSPILSVMHRQLSDGPNVEWEKNVWRRYGVDPDSEPDE